VTHLRKIMLEELERRNYTQSTIRHYLSFVERFARHFGKSPDKLGPEHLRSYQAYLLRERKLCPGTVENHVAALRFFFVRTLNRHEFRQFLPYPKVRKKLPKILSREEVAQLIDASSDLFQRTLLMVLYGTGMRRAEIARLKITDIDSRRMIIHVVNGKGSKDRDLPLSPALLETLRAHWRWLKPRTYLFPSRMHRDTEQPITDKIVWRACTEAAKRAGLRKRVTPHLVRHSWATHLLEAGTNLRTIQLLLGHEDLEVTARYLHLSAQHLQQVSNPIEELKLTSVDQSRRRYHRPLHP
jgi:integrase/recombinase XerD